MSASDSAIHNRRIYIDFFESLGNRDTRVLITLISLDQDHLQKFQNTLKFTWLINVFFRNFLFFFIKFIEF